MKIVVLAGGTSTEREISIVSGTGICGALRQKGHEAILVDIFCGVENVDWENPFPAEYDVEKTAEYMSSFNPQIKEMEKKRRSFFGPNVLELCEKCDIVFLGLHGANGEDGKVQAAFDLMGIRYTGTGYLSSAMAMDKRITKEVFLMNNVPTPGGFTMTRDNLEKDIAKYNLQFPVVVKTSCGGSSVGVYIVNDQKEYEEALTDACQYGADIVVEEYIKGREFSVAVVDEKAYPIIEIAPIQGFYDYKNKYQAAYSKNAGECSEGSESTGTYRLQPSGFHDERKRRYVLSGSKYPSGNDSYQSDSSGGEGTGNGLSDALRGTDPDFIKEVRIIVKDKSKERS